ncbi:GNAT family N-acetyltransferase [Bacillus sp. CBEL-1]|nr:GNAT family N-acetyltransferase [Bacillus sp. CBEL-1]
MQLMKANFSHIHSISTLYTDSWKTTYHGLIPDSYLEKLSYQDSEEKWSTFLQKDGTSVVAAFDDKQDIVGFGAYEPYSDSSHKGELVALYISDHAKGQGIGTLLMDFIKRDLYFSGVRSIDIWALGKNTHAINFYKRQGAQFVKTHPHEFEGVLLEDVLYTYDLTNDKTCRS